MAHDRRGFLGKLVGILTGAFGVAISLPAVGYLADPLRRSGVKKARPNRVARLDALPEGTPVKVDVVAEARDAWMRSPPRRVGAVWVVRRGSDVTAWTVVCPHLGCAVDYRGDTARFVCPCHDSVFDRGGRRVSGPSPRDLDRLEVRVENGDVFVQLVRFQKGTRDRVEVG